MSRNNLTGKIRRYTLTSKIPDEKLDQMLAMLREKKLHKIIAYELSISLYTITAYRKCFIQKRLLGE